MTPHRLFLSHCHDDDQPPAAGEPGWVSQFHHLLNLQLNQVFGRTPVELWRDSERLKRNEQFDDTITEAINRSDCFVAILSNPYLTSAYCQYEFNAFSTSRFATGDLTVGKLNRIVKVYRRKIEREDVRTFIQKPLPAKEKEFTPAPPQMVDLLDGNVGFDLFYIEDKSKRDREMLGDPAWKVQFTHTVDDIARDIKSLIDALPHDDAPVVRAQDEPAPAPTAKGSKPPLHTIYLAPTTKDLIERRKDLQREFEGLQWRVLPELALPEDAAGYEAAVREALAQSELSVHLIGDTYAGCPEGSPRSRMEIEIDLALAQRESALKTLMWMSPDRAVDAITDERQRHLIAKLKQAPFENPQAEFVRSSLDELRQLAVQRLEPPAPPAAPTSEVAAVQVDAKVVYLVCEPGERSAVKALKALLESHGMSVVRPASEGTAEELEADHRDNMIGCDVLLVYWGNGSEAWMRNKFSDANKAPGWGRNKPYEARLLVVAPPDSAAKKDFDTPPGAVSVTMAEADQRLKELLP